MFVSDSAAKKLTKKQRDFYEENGFLVIPNLVPSELIDECYKRFIDIVNGDVDSGSILKVGLPTIQFQFILKITKPCRNILTY